MFKTAVAERVSRHSLVTMASSQALSYTELDRTTPAIRILLIMPSNHFTAEIRCELSQAVLDDLPRFDALSYT
jgi:hypothetical protein